MHTRTIFLKSVTSDTKRYLQPAENNRKLGNGKNIIRKGRWKNLPLYTLTLEERKTCPKSCEQWDTCYGNNMPFAKRLNHTSPTFYERLSKELSELNARHPAGFVVRLHVLGDFFSKAYVRFWQKALNKHPALKIFGYTHRWPEHADGIGEEIEELNHMGAWIRYSDRGGEFSANVEGEGITCPQELGKTESCLTCGLCWQTTAAINFLRH